MHLTCPSCSAEFKVTVEAVDRTGKKYTADSPITPKAMRAVFEFMQHKGPGRYANSILVEGYNHMAAGEKRGDWPALTQQALMLALKRNGAEKWRTSSARGWFLPDFTDGARPAPAAPSVRAEIYEQELRKPPVPMATGGRPTEPEKPFDFSDLPFEIDIPTED